MWPWAPLVVLVTDRGQRLTLVSAFFYAPSVITIEQATLVEAVKQIEILFAMAIGVAFFGEAQRVRESAVFAVVMLLGMVLLALAS